MSSSSIRSIAVWCAFAVLHGAALPAANKPTAIFVMRTDGSESRKVAQVEGFQKHNSPQWSHDGMRPAFDASDGPQGVQKFFVINVDGNGLQEMGEQGMPHWSPDDKQLAFFNYNSKSLKRGHYVQNLDGKGRTWIGGGQCPRWSPDGGQIAYTTHRRTIAVSDLAEGVERNLFEEQFREILLGYDWSPDGKRLAFVGRRADQRELFLFGDEGLTLRLTRNMGGYLSWSPDGKQLAFSLARLIHVIDVDGAGGPKLIPGQQGNNSDPAWSPDGEWFAFSSDRKTDPVAARTDGVAETK